jgi:hypothetical protein
MISGGRQILIGSGEAPSTPVHQVLEHVGAEQNALSQKIDRRIQS